MYYITGDIHGNLKDLKHRCEASNLTPNDCLIVLGDFGANFYMNSRDTAFKTKVNQIGPTFFCVHGNHEARPHTIDSYKEKEWNSGIVYYEEEFPNLLFAKDGELYDIDDTKTFVCGGAYSVDKYYRAWKLGLCLGGLYPQDIADIIEDLTIGLTVSKEDKKKADNYLKHYSGTQMYWWKDEQPSIATKKHCETVLNDCGWQVDVVLTHTSPEKFEPVEMFISGLNQENVDKSTEKWLEKLEEKLNYKKWYAGHYHTNKKVNEKFQFLFGEVHQFKL